MYRFLIGLLVSLWLVSPVSAQFNSGGGGGSGSGIATVATFAPTCAASTAWFARLHNVDNVHLAGYDAFICGNVADGNGCASWGSGGGFVLDAIWMLASDSQAIATANMCSTANFAITVVNLPTFKPYIGYNGNGAAGSTATYLNTNIRTGTASASYNSTSSATIGVYDLSNRVTTGDNYFEMGAFGSSTNDFITTNNSLRESAAFARASGEDAIASVTTSQGLTIATRSGTTVNVYHNGNATPVATGTSTAGAAPTVSLYILALDNAAGGGNPEAGTTDTLSAAIMGGAMTATQQSQLSARLNTLMTASGINVF